MYKVNKKYDLSKAIIKYDNGHTRTVVHPDGQEVIGCLDNRGMWQLTDAADRGLYDKCKEVRRLPDGCVYLVFI